MASSTAHHAKHHGEGDETASRTLLVWMQRRAQNMDMMQVTLCLVLLESAYKRVTRRPHAERYGANGWPHEEEMKLFVMRRVIEMEMDRRMLASKTAIVCMEEESARHNIVYDERQLSRALRHELRMAQLREEHRRRMAGERPGARAPRGTARTADPPRDEAPAKRSRTLPAATGPSGQPTAARPAATLDAAAILRAAMVPLSPQTYVVSEAQQAADVQRICRLTSLRSDDWPTTPTPMAAPRVVNLRHGRTYSVRELLRGVGWPHPVGHPALLGAVAHCLAERTYRPRAEPRYPVEFAVYAVRAGQLLRGTRSDAYRRLRSYLLQRLLQPQ